MANEVEVLIVVANASRMYAQYINYGISENFSSGSLLPVEVSLTEYEQAFSYIRWYQYEEQFVILNSSSYALRDEIRDILANCSNEVNIYLKYM